MESMAKPSSFNTIVQQTHPAVIVMSGHRVEIEIHHLFPPDNNPRASAFLFRTKPSKTKHRPTGTRNSSKRQRMNTAFSAQVAVTPSLPIRINTPSHPAPIRTGVRDDKKWISKVAGIAARMDSIELAPGQRSLSQMGWKLSGIKFLLPYHLAGSSSSFRR